jgi:hypothetical protein
MDEHYKSPKAYENQLRARFARSWWTPILFGFVIVGILSSLMVAVIVLDQIGFIPGWVFGWVSRDRETQKRQFLIAIFGLLALWFLAQLARFGLLGAMARSTYRRILSTLTMPPDEQLKLHERICAFRNVWSAAFFVGILAWESILSWRALGKPFIEHNLYDLLFRIVLAIVYLPVLFKIFRCVPERFILWIVMIKALAAWAFEFAPNLVGPPAALIRQCDLVLSILAFLASVGILVSYLSNPVSA